MTANNPRGATLVRLALADLTTPARLEAASKACVALVADVLAGRSVPLHPDELHVALERVLETEESTSRALTAQLAAAGALQRLDDYLAPPGAPSEPTNGEELDGFAKLDLITDMGYLQHRRRGPW